MLPALFRLDEDLRPVPELAARWPDPEEITGDPFTVTVRLRDAEWSDGEPITARDVRFSWERLRDGPTGARYDALVDVEVGEDPRAMRLHFDRKVRRWWALFGIDDMVLPAHAYSNDWAAAPTVSGGPYRFAGAVQGLSVRLERNDAYWGEPAGAEAIEVLFVPEDERRLELLARGDLDAAYAAGESNWGRRAGARGFREVSGPLERGGASGSWGSTWWELDLDPQRFADDPDLAAAIVGVLDRALVAEILEDSGQVMNGIPARFPVGAPSEHGLPPIEGPWGGPSTSEGSFGGELTLAYLRGSTAASTIARFVHFAARPLGVRIELVGVEGDRFETDWVTEERADMYLVLRRGADAPDPTAYLPGARAAGRTPGTEELVALARSAVSDEDLRSRPVAGLAPQAWLEVQRVLEQSNTVVPLARTRTWVVATSQVAGPLATGTAAGPLWNAGTWSIEDG